ncbi:Protein containing SirA-like domain [Alloalcanivorax dieselolei B5]|uniref:Protein containing SirA-like domain n=1 Tax=Alcanivorax dieselolei (strain DSM 16502 / CGMCC 1.3690 / MCCC 1A00001 / B-5) TaxID=930169 RepID=K0CIT0_ALCDB|nr:sulfurtransferase TusA family protein [Alloalcanivorax dieselolei]AFT71486.1 Protein containing SirA-like domain [Alloalcanivorax dieselolei B5]GGJ90513.1 response regulator SirA [Alloalcanivorax dieselolei]
MDGTRHNSEDPMTVHQTLDARGLQCPLPLLKTRQALRHLAPGQMLRVLASDAGSARDIPAYLRQSPHDLVRDGETEGEYEFLIRCGAADDGA